MRRKDLTQQIALIFLLTLVSCLVLSFILLAFAPYSYASDGSEPLVQVVCPTAGSTIRIATGTALSIRRYPGGPSANNGNNPTVRKEPLTSKDGILTVVGSTQMPNFEWYYQIDLPGEDGWIWNSGVVVVDCNPNTMTPTPARTPPTPITPIPTRIVPTQTPTVTSTPLFLWVCDAKNTCWHMEAPITVKQ